MHSSLFFKLFPPPKFMVMKHAGLDISDDAIRCLEYSGHLPDLRISKHAAVEVSDKIIESGEIKDEKALADILSKFDHDNSLSYVKVSVPEEKAYLFQTDISTTEPRAIAQNIEFKLEENVPLTATDAVFYFDILPMSVTGGALRASVSVVPRAYIDKIVSTLRASGIAPIAFEVVPKSIARSIIPGNSSETVMIVHIMNKKTGIYIVSGGVVCFTSTIAWGGLTVKEGEEGGIQLLLNEITRVHGYWMSHGAATAEIKQVVLVGRHCLLHETEIASSLASLELETSVANVWNNAFSVDHYIPPISREDSLDFAVAAGLALELKK